MKKEYYILLVITGVGAVLRFWDLGVNPLWCDEALFAHWSRDAKYFQEYPSVFLANFFGLYISEYWLRFMFALAGTLTIPAIYFVVKKFKIESALMIAIFPLFIFWSRQARPYAFAGLFLVLGWRWWYFSIVSILTSPFAILGAKFWKQKVWIIIGLLITVIIVYIQRPDAAAKLSLAPEQLATRFSSSRFLYLPLLALILYITEYNWNYKILKHFDIRLAIFVAVIIISLTFFPANNYREWYSKEVAYSDWRGQGHFDFATNAHVSDWYNGSPCYEFLPRFTPLFNRLIEQGYTVKIGLDYYAMVSPYKEMFPKGMVDKFTSDLLDGKIVRLAVNKKEIKVY